MVQNVCGAPTEDGTACQRTLTAGRCPHHGTTATPPAATSAAGTARTTAAASTDPMAEAATSPPPWRGLVSIRENNDGTWSVTGQLYDPTSNDEDDGNYSREAKVAADLRARGLDDGVTFDSEAGMFCAYTTNYDSANQVAAAAARVCRDWHDADRNEIETAWVDKVLNGDPSGLDEQAHALFKRMRRQAEQAIRDEVARDRNYGSYVPDVR